MSLTNSQEEYLKAIYVLDKTTGKIKLTEIAKKMGISKASANNGVKAIKNEGLVNYEPYKEITLTKKGREQAIKIIQANDIVKVFLEDVLGVMPDVADKEAAKIKTILSDDTLNKLARHIYKDLGIQISEKNCLFDINNKMCLNCFNNKIEK